ncbi:MAG: hypothetical protein K6U03_08990 [Firmicutes bacterium]|nr:hypothetical protein [Bacillota bacterium]
MPAPLVVANPEDKGKGFLYGVFFFLLPLPVLVYCWVHGLTPAYPPVALGLHIAVVAVPILSAFLAINYLKRRLVFRDSTETPLTEQTFWSTLGSDWWMMALLWPAALLGLIILGHGLYDLLANYPRIAPFDPRSSVPTYLMTFGLSAFYAGMLKRVEVVRVSTEGVRVGLTQFMTWESIARYTTDGRFYRLYHRVNPNLPYVNICFKDRPTAYLFE